MNKNTATVWVVSVRGKPTCSERVDGVLAHVRLLHAIEEAGHGCMATLENMTLGECLYRCKEPGQVYVEMPDGIIGRVGIVAEVQN